MQKPLFLLLTLLGLTQQTPVAIAAPMDALMSAQRSDAWQRIEVEAGVDAMNDALDVFDLREEHKPEFGPDHGRYKGAHLRLNLNVSENLSLHGALWQRELDYRGDRADIQSWQLALQHRFLDAQGWRPAVAWRASFWGNQSDQVERSSGIKLGGFSVDSLTAQDPEDRQTQLDLVASWPLTEKLDFSMFAGGGRSKVSLREVNANVSRGGCYYDIAFEPDRLVGKLARPCNAGTVIERFSVPNTAAGVDVYRDTQYNANYVHAGFSTRWSGQRWELAGGYEYYRIDRGEFDDRLENQGNRTKNENHILVGEIRYRLNKYASLFARGQVMSDLFVGEIPFTYTGFTSKASRNRYGFVGTGLIISY